MSEGIHVVVVIEGIGTAAVPTFAKAVPKTDEIEKGMIDVVTKAETAVEVSCAREARPVKVLIVTLIAWIFGTAVTRFIVIAETSLIQ